MLRLLLLTVAGAWALGAQAPVGGPSLGFVFDARGQALRPIRGIPGASIFGDPLQLPAPVTTGVLSLKQNFAIINDGAWEALSLASASDPVPLPDRIPAAARVSVSDDGQAAAFYDADGGTLTVATGAGYASLRSVPLPGAISAFAVASGGGLLLTTTSPDSGEALLWIDSDGNSRQLATLQKTASILLTNNGATAIVTDSGANQIWRVQDPGGNAALTPLASDSDGVSGPVAAALTADGNGLWIANAGAHQLLGINLTDRTTATIDCAFDLTGLVPMPDGVTYRLNEVGAGPLWLLDASRDNGPRLVFVPALVPPPTSTSEEDAQ